MVHFTSILKAITMLPVGEFPGGTYPAESRSAGICTGIVNGSLIHHSPADGHCETCCATGDPRDMREVFTWETEDRLPWRVCREHLATANARIATQREYRVMLIDLERREARDFIASVAAKYGISPDLPAVLNGMPVVMAIRLPDEPGFRPDIHVVICRNLGDYRRKQDHGLVNQEHVIWFVSRESGHEGPNGEWICDFGDYGKSLPDAIDELRRRVQRAIERDLRSRKIPGTGYHPR